MSMCGSRRKPGFLKQQPCKVCGEPKTVAHHANYSKPLAVEWLCPRHHMLRHHEIGMTPEIRLARRQARAKEHYLQNRDYYKKKRQDGQDDSKDGRSSDAGRRGSIPESRCARATAWHND